MILTNGNSNKGMDRNATPDQEFEALRYFEGRVCTVFIAPSSRTLAEDREQIDYFVGHVDFVGKLGIWTSHTITGCRNFFFLNNILSISEEQVVDEDDPNYQEMKNQMEEKAKQKEPKPQPRPQFQPPAESVPEWMRKPPNEKVDIDSLSNLTRKPSDG